MLIELHQILIQALIEKSYLGDPISMFDFQATAIMPSFKQRWNNSAHSYKGLFIKDAEPIHDVEKNMLEPSPDDSEATVITE